MVLAIEEIFGDAPDSNPLFGEERIFKILNGSVHTPQVQNVFKV